MGVSLTDIDCINLEYQNCILSYLEPCIKASFKGCQTSPLWWKNETKQANKYNEC